MIRLLWCKGHLTLEHDFGRIPLSLQDLCGEMSGPLSTLGTRVPLRANLMCRIVSVELLGVFGFQVSEVRSE